MGDPNKILAFDEFELDFGRGELRRGGTPIEIQPTPLRLLLYLAEHRDRVVSRQELLDAVWPGVVVGDHALTTALKEARHAVGDDGLAQRAIRTRNRRGYRFVAGSPEREPPPLEPRGRADRPRVARAQGLAALATVSLALVGAFAWWARGAATHAPTAVVRPPHSLEVQPFRNLSPEPALEPFAAALSAQIADALQPPAHLISGSAAATHVLQGTLQEERARLRVTVQLRSVRSGLVLWSATYDQPRASLLAAQETIAARVGDEVPMHLPWEQSDDGAQAALSEVIARARGQIWSGDDEGALASLMGVIVRDPEQATAHQLLAFAWVNLMNHGKRPAAEAISKIQRHAEQARRIAPGSVAAHGSAALAALATYEWQAAEREARAACELDSSPVAFGCLALYTVLLSLGRAEEAEEIARGQIDFFPYLGYAHYSLGKALLVQRRYRDAERALMRAAELEPEGGMTGAYDSSGSLAALARLLDGQPWDIEAVAQRLRDEVAAKEVRAIFAADGERGVLRWLAKHGDKPDDAPASRRIGAAICYAIAGDHDDALAALESWPAMTDNAQYLWLPTFDGLRETTRFRAILEKMRLTADSSKVVSGPGS
jgi:DNA-binding winged helix-turn-helix (wHTH) protein/TolB-like protein/tetratricopeptide (TPR) repeat protein